MRCFDMRVAFPKGWYFDIVNSGGKLVIGSISFTLVTKYEFVHTIPYYWFTFCNIDFISCCNILIPAPKTVYWLVFGCCHVMYFFYVGFVWKWYDLYSSTLDAVWIRAYWEKCRLGVSHMIVTFATRIVKMYSYCCQKKYLELMSWCCSKEIKK